MSMCWRSLNNDLSRFLLIPAGMALASLVVCLLTWELFLAVPILLTLSLSLALSGLLSWLSNGPKKPTQYQVLVSVAIGWALISFVGALPLWLAASTAAHPIAPTVEYFRNGLNAIFEGFSGFTSAGLTMVVHPSELPRTLQWWRSLMQWVGGVGVVVLALALMEPTQNQYMLYQAEGREIRLRLTVTRTVRRIWKIYIGLTLGSIVLFRICGMPWWEALNHGMTAIATGGFSVTDGSMGAYSTVIKLAIMLVMILGAISFSLHEHLLTTRRLAALMKDRQHFLLLALLVLGTVILSLDNATFTGQFAPVDSAFQWVSALTTCGFSTEGVQFWSTSQKVLLSIGMILGGAAGSTVGGIKLNRILALLEAIAWRLRRPFLSSHETVLRWINGQPLKPPQASRQIEEAASLAVVWIVVITIATLFLMRYVPAEYDLSDVIFETASALGAAGISVGITGPSLHWIGKTVLIVLMWMGRLEIFPVVLLLTLPISNVLYRR